jgi:hypothetical protein
MTISGCTDSTSSNYNPLANMDDGTYCCTIMGCTDSTSSNYNPLANCDDGSCIPCIWGCTDDENMFGDPWNNYNPNATCNIPSGDDGSCYGSGTGGCMDPASPNYQPNANYPGPCLGIGDTYQGGIIFHLDGNGGGLVAAPQDQSINLEWDCAPDYINCYSCDNSFVTIGSTTAINTAIGTGNQNTNEIVNDCQQSPYFLTNISVDCEVCNDADLLSEPDAFFYLLDQNNAIRFVSNVNTDQDFPNSWTTYVLEEAFGSYPNHDFRLENQNYTVQVMDENTGADTELGSVSFPGYSSSGSNTATSTITYSVLFGILAGETDDITVNYTIDYRAQTLGAAAKCKSINLNGYTDWFLPSRDELTKMAVEIGTSVADGGIGNIGNFGNFKYWSSTNVEGTENAISVCFYNQCTFGTVNTEAKSTGNAVRAIRAF